MDAKSSREDLASSTATIDELLSDVFVASKGEKRHADLAALRLAAWCRASASGDWVLFANRLARDSLSIEAVLSRFGTAHLNSPTETPSWLQGADWILASFAAEPDTSWFESMRTDQELPFDCLLGPLVQAAEVELKRQLSPDQPPTCLAPSAWLDLCKSLLIRLTELCATHLLAEFHKCAGVGLNGIEAANSKPPSARFDEFVSHMRRGGLVDFLVGHPVLLRLVVSIANQWIDVNTEFVSRLTNDLEEVTAQLLQTPDPGRVSSIATMMSDLHNQGRSVYVVYFEKGQALVYKPKDLKVDYHWSSVVAWLNDNGAPFVLRTPAVVAKDGYGWAEYVGHDGCSSVECLRRFFRRSGGYLALFHLFSGTDMHHENIVACGDQPIPVDLEMLFQPTPKAPTSDAFDIAQRRLSNSVAVTGFLPVHGRSWAQRAFVIGGLREPVPGASAVVWEHVNSDHMRMVTEPRQPPRPRNLPHVEGVVGTLEDYASELLEGFEEYGRFLSRSRAAILSAGLIERFADTTTRKVVRPTRFYYSLIQRLIKQADAMDGPTWSTQLDFVSRFADWRKEVDEAWPLLQAERASLASLNIPYFKGTPQNSVVSDGTAMSADLEMSPGLETVRSRIGGFDDRQLDEQLSIVRTVTSASAHRGRGNTQPWPLTVLNEEPPDPEHATEELSDAARWASEAITQSAIRSNSTAAWIGLDWLGDSDLYQLAPLGFDLYNGVTGIAMFLAAYAATTGDHDAAVLANEALAPLYRSTTGQGAARLARRLGLGGGLGLGSIIYGLTAIYELLGDREHIDRAQGIVSLISDELIEADRNFDAMSGCAGAIVGCLKLYFVNRSEEALTAACRCGDHLLRNEPASGLANGPWVGAGLGPKPLTGMSHGASGYALAFARLFEATAIERYASAADSCLDYEKRHFSQERLNWPDFRNRGNNKESWTCQWCHGAAGIGLARLSLMQSSRSSRRYDSSAAEMDSALRCVDRRWSGEDNSLCCGNLGNIEFILEAANVLGRPEIGSDALRKLRSVARTRQSAPYALGLFRGLAGVGYTMLRRLNDKLPNVLVWE